MVEEKGKVQVDANLTDECRRRANVAQTKKLSNSRTKKTTTKAGYH